MAENKTTTEITVALMRQLNVPTDSKIDRSIIQSAIEAAEERGRQSMREECDNYRISVGLMACEMQRMLQPPCEWEDLKHLTGRELRDRLKSRAETWRAAVDWLENMHVSGPRDGVDRLDRQILIDMLYEKSNTVYTEAERLWSEYLDSYEQYLDKPGGRGLVTAELGPQYIGVIVDRAAAKKGNVKPIVFSKGASCKVCSHCGGVGTYASYPPLSCIPCKGTGVIPIPVDTAEWDEQHFQEVS